MLALIGINHNTASVEQRELFAFSADEALRFVRTLVNEGLIRGGVLLSTCNRFELYVHLEQPGQLAAVTSAIELQKSATLSTEIAYQFCGAELVRHLFSLASGLRSMVVGETQILGQIKDAYKLSDEAGLTTALLVRLFNRTFEAAKQVRSACFISAIPTSAGSAAVELITSLPQINCETNVLILGAGRMADTIMEALHREEYYRIEIYNRTRERAERFAGKYGLPLYAEEELPAALASADTVFVATSSSSPVITSDLLHEVIRLHGVCPAVFFDMAVPRNVDATVGNMEGISVYTIDDLKKLNNDRLDRHGIQADRAKAIIEEAAASFAHWQAQERLRKSISLIQQHSHELLARDLQQLQKSCSEAEITAIRPALEHLRITFTTDFISKLRQTCDEIDSQTALLELINRLFRKP